MANLYELLIIIHPEKDSSKTISQIEKLLKKFGGNLEIKDEWGMRKLAYPIEDQTKGYYVLFFIKLGALQVKPLSEAFKIEEEIMREIIVRRNF